MGNKVEGVEKILSKTGEFLGFLYELFGYTYTRPMTSYLKYVYKKSNLVGVEIGTFKGENAKNILERLDMRMLYLVDPYIKYSKYHDFKSTEFDGGIFSEAKRMTSKYESNIKFIKKFSGDASNNIPDNLDFVYVDGNHDYDFVKRDIELYYPKVMSGGIFGGHNFGVVFNDVCKAVLEFTEKNNLRIYGSSNDWWVIKP